MGTIVNAVAIVVGGLIGLALKGAFINRYSEAIKQAIGLAVAVIAINGILTNTLYFDDVGLHSRFELLIVLSLVIGAVIGEVLKIDQRITGLSDYIEKKFQLVGFSKSFMTASIIFSVGAMAIVGALNDGLLNDPSLLYVKAALDGITSLILATSLGMGVIFSSLVVLVYQGAITLLAQFLAPYLQGELLYQICAIGFILVLTIATNMLNLTKFKTANFIPSLLIPAIWFMIKSLF